MAQDGHRGPADDEAAAELAQIADIQVLLEAFSLLEGTCAPLATSDELKSAEGRRCILAISGLKHNQASFFFEILGARIRQVQPFDKFTTHIAAPIDSVTRVLKGALDGDENAFTNEWSRGQATLVGEHSVHDGYQFNEAFRRLA